MAISTRQVKNKRDSNGVLTGRPGTVYDVNIKYTAPDGKKKSYAKKGFATKKEAAQHEAVFYLMSRGMSEEDARALIVSGFADNVSKELPLEYAVEMNNLIRLEMKGSIG